MSYSSSTIKLFVTCTKGMEHVLADELEEMGFSGIEIGYAGVLLESDLEGMYRINYLSRVASRVLWPLKRFRCWDPKDLYKAVDQISWCDYLTPKHTFAIDAHCLGNRQFRNSLFAAQKVKDVLCDQLREEYGERPSVQTEDPELQLNLYIKGEWATLSLDTSGCPLHKRRYRRGQGKAPVKENLAAGLLKMAHYSGEEDLVDPCCGSGTFLIEAALMATKTPPGILRRRWGFLRLPNHDEELWQKVKKEAEEQIQPPKGRFLGVDCDPKALQVAKDSAKRAGMEFIQWRQGRFQEVSCPWKGNFLVTNPPFGKRIEAEGGLQPLYRALGDFMKQQLATPGRGYVLTANMPLSKQVGLRSKRRMKVFHGGEEARFLEFELY